MQMTNPDVDTCKECDFDGGYHKLTCSKHRKAVQVKKALDLGATVRQIARNAIPVVPKTQIVPSKKHKQPKHKKKVLNESINS